MKINSLFRVTLQQPNPFYNNNKRHKYLKLKKFQGLQSRLIQTYKIFFLKFAEMMNEQMKMIDWMSALI